MREVRQRLRGMSRRGNARKQIEDTAERDGDGQIASNRRLLLSLYMHVIDLGPDCRKYLL